MGLKIFYPILAILFNTIAPALAKQAMTESGAQLFTQPLKALTHIPFMGSLTCYGLSFIFYSLSLTHFPLNVVHPIVTTTSLLTVTVISVLVFKENFHILQLVGMFLLVSGIVLIAISQGRT
jgi:small multidrug resistance pump